jgi:mono/diheme cytochrome c family protein
MKKWVVLLGSGAILAFLLGCGVSKPGSIESRVAKEIKSKVTIGGKDDQNPIAYSEAVAKEGGEHFQHHCQICHGLDGQNTGVPFAEHMSPPVPDLTSKDVQDYKDGQLKWIIENGIAPSGMPAWKGILDEEEMWHIVHYIRHLPPKGSLGAPTIFEEKDEEHKKMHDESKPHTHHHH